MACSRSVLSCSDSKRWTRFSFGWQQMVSFNFRDRSHSTTAFTPVPYSYCRNCICGKMLLRDKIHGTTAERFFFAVENGFISTRPFRFPAWSSVSFRARAPRLFLAVASCDGSATLQRVPCTASRSFNSLVGSNREGAASLTIPKYHITLKKTRALCILV